MPNPIGHALRNRRAGQHSLAWARPDLQAPNNFALTSSAFEHHHPIPGRYKGRLLGENISPALAWTNPPATTVSLLLVVQDPDVPQKYPSTHAIAMITDPSVAGIPENGLMRATNAAGVELGRGPLGRLGWAGPAPIPSHGPHSYVFQLFALDNRLVLPVRFTLKHALAQIPGHVIGRARLDGTYEIR